MDRKEELLDYLCKTDEERLVIESLVDEFLFIEKNLKELKKLPFIKIHPSNPELQKATPASKLYKELLQQYTNIAKVLNPKTNDPADEESPLRKWVKKHVDTE